MRPAFKNTSVAIVSVIGPHHREIESKSCAPSAKDDNLATMKTYLPNVVLTRGMDQDTMVPPLAERGHHS